MNKLTLSRCIGILVHMLSIMANSWCVNILIDEPITAYNVHETEAARNVLRQQFFRAAATGTADQVDAALLAGAQVSWCNDRRDTSLIVAAGHGNSPVVRLLLERKARVDSAGDTGQTALHAAVCSGDIPAVRALLVRGADKFRADHQGCTPLAAAFLLMHLHEKKKDGGMYRAMTHELFKDVIVRPDPHGQWPIVYPQVPHHATVEFVTKQGYGGTWAYFLMEQMRQQQRARRYWCCQACVIL